MTNTEIDVFAGVAGRTYYGSHVYPCRLVIKVGFGLLLCAKMRSAFGAKVVRPALLRDQPQVSFHTGA